MANPVSGRNPVDGRGRGRNPVRGKSLRLGIPKQPWLNFPWTGNNSTQQSKLQLSSKTFLFLVTFCSLILCTKAGNPHEPMQWQLQQLDTSKIISNFTGAGTPTLYATPCQLIGEYTPVCEKQGWQGNKSSAYFCPASNPGKEYCNYPGHYYCAYWGCETIALEWGVNRDKDLKVKWEPQGCKVPSYTHGGDVLGGQYSSNCQHLKIIIMNPIDDNWLVGKMWGVRIRKPGPDRGGFIRIIKQRLPYDPLPIGPNQVLNFSPLPKDVYPVNVSTHSLNLSIEQTNNTEVKVFITPETSRPKDPL